MRTPGDDEVKTATLLYTLHACNLFSTIWWPFRTLYGGDTYGHIQCQHDRLLIQLLPGAGGILSTSKEVSDQLGDSNHKIVVIPWHQVCLLVNVCHLAEMRRVGSI